MIYKGLIAIRKRIERTSGIIEDKTKSNFEVLFEKMKDQINYILGASENIKLEIYETIEEERKTVSEIKDLKLFESGLLITTSGEGESYIEGLTDDKEILESLGEYKEIQRIKEEGEIFYIYGVECRDIKIPVSIFLATQPVGELEVEITESKATIELSYEGKKYIIKAILDKVRIEYNFITNSQGFSKREVNRIMV